MKFTTMHTVDTEYSADSVEWCPYPGHRALFVCGTYQLEDDSQSESPAAANQHCRRKGRLYLYKFNIHTGELNELQRLETAAILDMKWLPPTNESMLGGGGCSSSMACSLGMSLSMGSASGSSVGSNTRKPTLAAANALGQVEIYQLVQEENEGIKLKLFYTLTLSEEHVDLLALSLDWNGEGNEILVSDSKGGISLLSYEADGGLIKLNTWTAHSFEAWICAFDKWDEHRAYTGGDDCLLHAYDFRTSTRIWTNKAHMAGVTCLLSYPRREHTLLTGSYDETLRVFDTRNMRRTLAEVNLHGGIWRLKMHPLRDHLVLAACMYENFSVVDVGSTAAGSLSASLVGTFNEHSSICYGSDWCQDVLDQHGEQPLYMATCSFYDHKLCVAKVEQ